MNLNQFKLLKEDDSSYHLAHPNGKKFSVAKEKLSSKAHEKIKALMKGKQHFDEGGQAAPEAPSAEVVAVPELAQPANAPQGQPLPTSGRNIEFPNQNAPQAMGTPKVYPGMEGALQQEKAANQAMAGAQQTQATEEQNAIATKQMAVAELPSQSEIIQANKAKDDKLFQSYQDAKIDPNRYWHNTGTAGKIAAGLGMILSGAGSAVAGQDNMAISAIQGAIHRDIEAQKADQSNKLNLWKMNREALGNDLAANLATQNQLYTGLKYQLLSAASKSSGAQAQAKAMQGNALIDQQIAQNRFKMSLMNGPTKENQDPAQLVNWLVQDPGEQKTVAGEIKRAQDTRRISSSILEDFDKAAKDVRPLSGGRLKNILPYSESAYQGALEQHLMTTLQDVEGSVKQTAADSLKHTMMPKTGNSDQEIAIKRAALVDYLASKQSAPNAKRYGIDLDKFQSTHPVEQAPQMQSMNGIQYQKVPGGWKRVAQ